MNSISRLDTKALFSYQKWVVLLSFVTAALLTPTPDVFNQLLMALPIILLYQATVGIIWFMNRRQVKHAKRSATARA